MAGEDTKEFGFFEQLAARGIDRRTFLKFCGGVAAAAGLTSAMVPRVAQAIEAAATNKALLPVVWLEAGSCTGCTESFAQGSNPDVGTVVLDLVSLNYSETLSAGAGHSLEEAKAQTIAEGGYVLVYEGAVMTGWDGNALVIAEEKGVDILRDAASNAVAVIACGSCAVDGGWCAGDPNPAGAMGVQEFFDKNGIAVPVVNIPACPANPENVVAAIVTFLMAGSLPALNAKNMPAEQFNQTIHDNCQRRGHFENGEFVYAFGTEEERLGYCLYAMGCRGPQTYSNCSVIRWNRKASWCVESGAPCCGCAEANPGTSAGNWVNNNAPFFSSRFRDVSVGGFRFQIDPVAIGVTVIVAAAVALHAFGMKQAGRTGGGAEFEEEKDYDRKKRLYRQAYDKEKGKLEEKAAAEAADEAARDAADKGGDAR